MPAPILLRGECDAALGRLARKAKDGKAMEKAKAGRRKKNPSRDTRGLQPSKTLSDLSISYDQSSHWQQLADIPDEDFEAALAGPEKPSTSGTIAQLKPKPAAMPGAPAAIRQLSGADVRIRIITHRFFIKYFHQVAAKQTIEWLDHYDIPYWDLCFMQEKAKVDADIYVEDSPKNVELLRAENVPTIVFTNSTNEHLPGPRADTWAQVVDLVLAHKEKWERDKVGCLTSID